MTIIRAQWIDDQAVVPKEDFHRLLEIARKSEPIDLCEPDEELSAKMMMRLAEKSGAFDFWSETGEDIYSTEDGEPV